MEARNRNTAIVFITTGMYLLLGHLIGFVPVTALIVVLLGFYKLKVSSDRKSYVLIAVGLFILLGEQVAIGIAILLIVFGIYFMRKRTEPDTPGFVQRQGAVESLRWDREAWVIRNTSMWYAVAEIRMDFSLGLPEEKEATIILQGVIGDLDIVVPEDFGLQIVSSVMLGQVQALGRKESGVMNKFVWQTPHYETSEHKVRLILSYVLADVDIKVLG